MPKTRAKEKAKEGHIYISSGQERREKTKFIFDCLKMNGKRRLLHVDPWYLETKAAMTFRRVSFSFNWTQLTFYLLMGQLWGGETNILAIFHRRLLLTLKKEKFRSPRLHDLKQQCGSWNSCRLHFTDVFDNLSDWIPNSRDNLQLRVKDAVPSQDVGLNPSSWWIYILIVIGILIQMYLC